MRRGILKSQEKKHFTELLRRAKADEGDTGAGEGAQGATSSTQGAQGTGASLDVNTLLENARTEERNKLHKTIDDLKGKLKASEDSATALSTKLNTANQTITTLEGEVERMKVEANASADEVVKGMKLQLTELEGKLSKAEADVVVWQQKYSTLELSNFTDTLIREANGKLVKELVRGSTTEEIQASVELAKQAYNNIVAGVTSQGGAQGGASTSTGAQAGAGTTDPVVGGTDTIAELSGMNVMKSKKDREAYMQLRGKQ